MDRLLKTVICCLVIAGGVLPGVEAQGVITSYHVGNSLTQDSQPLVFEDFAATRGFEVEVGYHIRAGSSLHNIIANPTDVSVEPTSYGTFSQALPNNAWDIVTIQPHPNQTPLTTMGQDIDSILSLINLTRSNPANANTNFYIYQAWPAANWSLSYRDLWEVPSPDNLNTQMQRRREYYDNLIEHVRAQTDANVYMVPVGEVLAEMDARLEDLDVPGFDSSWRFYRDGLHMTYGPGRFLASATTFATIYGQYPTGLEVPEDHFGGPIAVKPEIRDLILEVVRDVLDKHPYSGVTMPPPLRADFDNNLTVDENDFDVWEASQGITNPYDFEQDKDVDGRDFLFWQRNFQTELPEELLSVADLNGDGTYNAQDIALWHASYGVNTNADVDGDGDTDGRDFLKWQRYAKNNLADMNGDYVVDSADLTEWQRSYGYATSADANRDGIVDLTDYQIWQQENGLSWNYPRAFSAPPLASQQSNSISRFSVPEPNSFIILMVLTSLKMLSTRAGK